ncbi:phage minor head protein [Neisseria elongata]|uniref:phage minor head protein n=1 Tax=Neisseria elongata TaxID=495 RepID=UPI000D3121BE|nr:phage minor head protein [Neisseria elongata]
MDGIEYDFAGLVDKAAFGHFKAKKILPGFSHYDVWLYQHSLAFTVAKMMDADMLAEVKDAIEAAQRNGTAFADFKKRLKPYLMAKGWWGEQIMTDPLDGEPKLVQLGSTRRLKTIFDTNMRTAFAAGQWQRIQANKKALPYLRYNKSASGHPRDGHKRYYGLVLPVDHDIWKVIFPPNGYGCKCSVSALTKRQAEEEGIGGEPDAEMVEFTNPRTGQKVLIPDDITPSFAHNHGDRQGAMDALFGDKHGEAALAEMIAEREAWLDKRYSVPSDKVAVLALPDKVSEKEVRRLTKEQSANNTKDHEARAAAAWQAETGDRLEVFDLAVEKGKGQADYLIVSDDLPREEWVKLDFMFTENPERAELMNRYFAHTIGAWNTKVDKIQEHFDKADIVPLDLRHLNAANRHKLLQYVLSLPKEQRDKVRLLVKISE